jgi:hypothetical protein
MLDSRGSGGMEEQMAPHMIQIVIDSSFPRRREPISCTFHLTRGSEMDPRLRGDDDLEKSVNG